MQGINGMLDGLMAFVDQETVSIPKDRADPGQICIIVCGENKSQEQNCKIIV